eukprot:3021429-Prymnesium_polylepis.2
MSLLPWRCMDQYARSQWGEDRLLLPLLLDATRARPGVFVELGALDGDTYSNTILLEKCFNWTGILIEANPTNFARLQQSGRKATLVHAAVCVGIPSITMTLQGGPASGDVSGFSKKQKRRFDVNQVGLSTRRLSLNALSGVLLCLTHAQCSHMRAAHTCGREPACALCGPLLRAHTQTVEVPCKSLTQIMAEAGHPTANFLSLDVEGAEDKVLKAAQPDAFDLERERTTRTRRLLP